MIRATLKENGGMKEAEIMRQKSFRGVWKLPGGPKV